MLISCFYVVHAEDQRRIIVIDPGHGGEDGGAEYMGYIEAELNLKIALKLKDVYEENGYRVVMTRTENKSLCDDGFNKRRDMDKRIDIINSANALYMISIHLNIFSDSRYYGAQTFYSAVNSSSILLADFIQTSIIESLKNTKRQIVKRDNIYLLNKVTIPAVIVECGFLTNDDERNRLIDEEYQRALVWAIFDGASLMEIYAWKKADDMSALISLLSVVEFDN